MTTPNHAPAISPDEFVSTGTTLYPDGSSEQTMERYGDLSPGTQQLVDGYYGLDASLTPGANGSIPAGVKWQEDVPAGNGNLPAPDPSTRVPSAAENVAPAYTNTKPWAAPEASSRVPNANEFLAVNRANHSPWFAPDPRARRPFAHEMPAPVKKDMWSTPDPSKLHVEATGAKRENGSPDLKEDLFNLRWETARKHKDIGRLATLAVGEGLRKTGHNVGKPVRYIGKGLKIAALALKPNIQDSHVEGIRRNASLKDLEASLHIKGMDKNGVPTTKDLSRKIDQKRFQADQLRKRAARLEQKHQTKRAA